MVGGLPPSARSTRLSRLAEGTCRARVPLRSSGVIASPGAERSGTTRSQITDPRRAVPHLAGGDVQLIGAGRQRQPLDHAQAARADGLGVLGWQRQASVAVDQRIDLAADADRHDGEIDGVLVPAVTLVEAQGLGADFDGDGHVVELDGQRHRQ